MIIDIIGLLIGVFALYTFVFIAELQIVWKIVLIIAAAGWIITCVSKMAENRKK